MIIFRSWPKILWLSIELDEAPSAQISRNLEKILSILNFLALKTGFLRCALRHVAHAYNWEISKSKTLHLWIFHQNLCMLMDYLRI